MSQSWKGKDDIVRGSLDLVIICLMIKLPVEIKLIFPGSGINYCVKHSFMNILLF